jgi:hypothetical protein
VRWLTTPAQCGVFLSIADLVRVGEGIGIRIMPMSRSAAVEQLFRTAALDDNVDNLFEVLIREIEAHRTSYTEIDSRVMQPWIEHADATVMKLRKLQGIWRENDAANQSD